MPESSQQHIKIERICFDCGDLVQGLKCLNVPDTKDIWRKLSNFKILPKSSNDNSNVVNAPREPFDVNKTQDCPDCEDSQFCHSSRVSHPQLHLGIRYPNLID
ncbi:hypothetical protein Tco_0336548 [Tanacetum coccineum]